MKAESRSRRTRRAFRWGEHSNRVTVDFARSSAAGELTAYARMPKQLFRAGPRSSRVRARTRVKYIDLRVFVSSI